MEKTYHYHPEDVCSREMIITLDGETISNIRTIGGCPGNTQGVNKLCEGRNIHEVIALLSNIRCPGSKTSLTSCPDQLSKGLKAILEGKLNS